jgi:hypothetical protein
MRAFKIGRRHGRPAGITTPHAEVTPEDRKYLESLPDIPAMFKSAGSPLNDGRHNGIRERLPRRKSRRPEYDPLDVADHAAGYGIRSRAIVKSPPSGETPEMYYARGGQKTVLPPALADLSTQLTALDLGLRIYEGNYFQQR